MKKIKTIIGIFLCLFLSASTGYSRSSTAKEPHKQIKDEGVFVAEEPSALLVDCNINAGGNLTYCFNETKINLYGSQSGINLSTVNWSVVSSPSGTTVTIASPSSLTTSFTSAPSFLPGNYTFVISGNCASDNTLKTDTVVITVTPAVTQAVISDGSGPVTANPYVVCTQVQLTGTTPAAGETGYWSAQTNPSGHTFSPSGTTLNASMTPWNTCDNVTYYYTISNGGCVSIDTVTVRYLRVQSPVTISGGDRSLCGDTISVVGSFLGCSTSSATASWQIIPPSGVAVPASTTGDRVITIYFTTSGTYQIIYNVTSTGVCPGGSDTVTYNICISSANGIGANETRYVCDDYPDTVFLSSLVHSFYSYGNWAVSGYAGTPPVTIVQTGTGQAYALIHDQTPAFYNFVINATGDSCNFSGVPTIRCNASKLVQIRRATRFTADADTLNIFCQSPGTFYTPNTYITTVGIGNNFVLNALQVPTGCTSISTGVNYSPTSSLDFSCEGTYIFRAVISTSIGNGQFCRDTMQWVVNVATLQNPSAGSDSYIRICDNDTVPLVGSAAIDIHGNLNPNAISTWTQIDANPPVTFVGSVNSQTVNATGFSVPGVYMFEYSFSRGVNCYLADTMFVIVEECEACPEFSLQTCCDLLGGNVNARGEEFKVDPMIQKIIDDYQKSIQTKYERSSMGCCDYCEHPTDSFPVFITDTANFLINPSLYTITWSNDGTNHNNVGYVFPNQQVIVTITGPDSCVSIDTFLIKCCPDTINIESYCTWDPCEYPTVPVPLRVVDGSGSSIGAGYTIMWSNGFTTNSTSALISMMPIWVTVTDTLTGCVYTDTFDIICEDPCIPKVPGKLMCSYFHGVQTLSWANIPGMTYELEITYNDPLCCGTLARPYTRTYELATNSYSGPYETKCFSWRVRSICPDGTKSDWSESKCSCIPVVECIPTIPNNLKCEVTHGGQMLSWSSIPGVTYEIEINYNDPKCCNSFLRPRTVIYQTTNPNYFVSGTGCFSWRVRSICPNGVSKWSDLKCSCAETVECKPETPTDLKCDSRSETLSWTHIPGATYEIEINYNDPECCRSLALPTSIRYTLTTNSYSGRFAHRCFSWRVRTICPDGVSRWSELKCSCFSEEFNCLPIVPFNLKCRQALGGQLLSWDAIPGRTYEVSIYYGDPLCCGREQLQYISVPIATTTNSLFVSSTACFSWKVRSICITDGKKSKWSTVSCGCAPIIRKSGEAEELQIITDENTSGGAQQMDVSIAPNPAKDFVIFDVITTETNQGLGKLEITTVTGQLVHYSQIMLNGKTIVDLTNLNGGTYIYKVTSDGTFKTGRIVITD